MALKCPICDSEDIVRGTSRVIFNEPFGGEKAIELINYICNNCNAEGDFFEENEETTEATINELKSDAVINILKYFTDCHFPFSSIERLLGLPQRTLTKWKNKATLPHAAGVTLLKYVRLFPWLLQVSECKYDYDVSQKIHITDAINRFFAKVTFEQTELSTIVNTTYYGTSRPTNPKSIGVNATQALTFIGQPVASGWVVPKERVTR